MQRAAYIFLTLLVFLVGGNFGAACNREFSASPGDLCAFAVQKVFLTTDYTDKREATDKSICSDGDFRNFFLSVPISEIRGQKISSSANQNGHRTQIRELSGRTINNTFDKLHRLTAEGITQSGPGILPGALTHPTGTLSYSYDLVGNRQSRTTSGTVSQIIPSQSQSFTANDRLTSDTYDANGNTTQSSPGLQSASSVTDVYSFDNKLIRRTNANGQTIDLTYNSDGHRLAKLISQNGLTQSVANYLTDANNPTGYAQVIEEKDPLANVGQELKKVHLYGHDLISSSVSQPSTLNHQLLFYSYDGLGSVRGITNESGELEETYDYDAYGTLIGLAKRNSSSGDLESSPITNNSSPITKSEFLFTGELWDGDLGMYFLRARYLNTNTGRFHTQDTYEGRNAEPLTLHKYLYANGNPAMFKDPSGMFSLTEQALVNGIIGGLANLTLSGVSGLFTPGFYERDSTEIWKDLGVSFATGVVGGAVGTVATRWLRSKIVGWAVRPFIKNIVAGAFGGAAAGFSTQLATEIYEFTVNQRPITDSTITEAGGRITAFTIGGLISGGFLANVRITGRKSYEFSIKSQGSGLAAMPFEAMTGSREAWNIVGLSGVTGGSILGNLLTYYYSEIYE